MKISTLVTRNLGYYWRNHAAVAAGVAVAVAVLAGALLVGDSVRGSLRDLVLSRLGKTDSVVTSSAIFREKLAGAFQGSAPLTTLEAVVSKDRGRRIGGVQVYGVDERFWQFQGEPQPADGAGISVALARDLDFHDGEAVLVRVPKYSAIPLESLHGRKDDAGRTLRLNPRVLAGAAGEFSLRPQQGDVRAVFVPLHRLQRDLKTEGHVNTLLLPASADAAAALRSAFTLDDLGVRIRVLDNPKSLAIEKESTLLDDALIQPVMATAQAMKLTPQPMFTYLVNTVRVGGREIPYSLVTATEDRGVWLNDWAARELAAKAGDTVEIEYYVWQEGGALSTAKASFRLDGVSPMGAFDPGMAPEYPGITTSKRLVDWDPPFPMDMKRIRPRDEAYWDRFHTTPKLILPLKESQRLWPSRFGSLTAIRLRLDESQEPAAARDEFARRLRAAIDPGKAGLTVFPARAQSLAASRGATDFSEYFVYFSFFLVVSAVMLVGLFFKLGVEQRSKEIGVLRTIGFAPAALRRIFLREGVLLAAIGGVIGVLGAAGYGWLIMEGLRTWWIGAVGTTLLRLHLGGPTLAYGFAGGLITSVLVIAWTLRGLEAVTPRGLVHGSPAAVRTTSRVLPAVTAICAVLGLGLLAASTAGAIGRTAGFFGAGSLLLIAALAGLRAWLGSTRGGIGTVARLGLRNAAFRPGRSTLCIALIASATFIIVAIDAFRRAPEPLTDKKAGHGGFALLAESLLPVVYDPNTAAGQENLNLAGRTDLAGVHFTSFRLKPGDDASCLNLYEPRNPRILGAPASFLQEGRFRFQESLEQSANPWLLLEKESSDGTIPAIADANSMTYVLHRNLGDEFVLDAGGAHPIRLRLVAALADSVLQGELIISEKNFLRVFPEQQGFRFFLVDAPSERARTVAAALAEALSDYGVSAVETRERLDTFHRVENTYLSTFQTLGGLGLVLGTLGLAAVLLRNVLEQRRELALLRAVGYRAVHLAALVLAENIFLLGAGLLSGTLAAVVAITPALTERGGHWPLVSWVFLLPGVLITGLAASIAAVAAAIRSPILPALRSE